MRKKVSLALVLVMLCALLSGCMYESFDVDVNADGSGTIAVQVGLSKELLDYMKEDAEDPAALDAKYAELQPFEAEGQTWYGKTVEAPFASPEAFAAAFASLSQQADEVTDASDSAPSIIRLERDGNGLTLVVDNRSDEESDDTTDTAETADTTETADTAETEETTEDTEDADALSLSDEDMESAMTDSGVVMRIVARFASPVTQIAGPADGVTIEGGALTLDLTNLAQEAYRFTTRKDVALAYDRPLTIDLDGKAVELSCYALKDAQGNETNYVRVRDLAALLNGTKAQFGVAWKDGAVNLNSATPYGESTERTPFSGARAYQSVAAKTIVNGRDAALDTLVLQDEDNGGYTYYKLRDLGEALGFNVRWDGARSIVCVESGKPYTG